MKRHVTSPRWCPATAEQATRCAGYARSTGGGRTGCFDGRRQAVTEDVVCTVASLAGYAAAPTTPCRLRARFIGSLVAPDMRHESPCDVSASHRDAYCGFGPVPDGWMACPLRRGRARADSPRMDASAADRGGCHRPQDTSRSAQWATSSDSRDRCHLVPRARRPTRRGHRHRRATATAEGRPVGADTGPPTAGVTGSPASPATSALGRASCGPAAG